MNSLRANWSKRLEAAQLDSSWQGQIEARVLRFLMSRYGDVSEEAPLPDVPFFQGEAPHGRAKLPLSTEQLRARLGHIAQVESERPPDKRMAIDFFIQQQAHQEFLLRRKNEEFLLRRKNQARHSNEDNPLTKLIILRFAEILWVFITLLALYFFFSSSGL